MSSWALRLPVVALALLFAETEAAGQDFTTATELADELVRRGLPFRSAHEVVGKLVRQCVDQGRALQELSAEELRAASSLLDDGARQVLDPEAAVRAKTIPGGTAPTQVAERIKALRATFEQERSGA